MKLTLTLTQTLNLTPMHNPIHKPVAYFPGEVVDLQERRKLYYKLLESSFDRCNAAKSISHDILAILLTRILTT